jgi:hypothetical protein
MVALLLGWYPCPTTEQVKESPPPFHLKFNRIWDIPQTQRAYCKTNELSYHRFGYWRRKFRQQSQEAQSQKVSGFVPVSHSATSQSAGPAVRLPPAFVAINPILAEDGDKVLADHVNFPTITAAGYVSDKGK